MRDDELDRIIDGGLSTYAEPPAGLERRLLTAVADRVGEPALPLQKRRDLARLLGVVQHAPRSMRRPAFRAWAVGCAAAACLVIAIVAGMRGMKVPRPINQQAINKPQPRPLSQPTVSQPSMAAPVRTVASRPLRPHHGTRMRPLPKRETFPTLQPISPQLQVLVRYVANAPKAAREQLAQTQAQMDKPIVIAPLHIAPLNESTEDEH